MTGYEKRDIRFATILEAFAALALAVAVVALASSLTLKLFASRRAATPRREAPPPGPRLQAEPTEELRRYRAEEDAALNGCAWIDRSRGVVRLPIERAMALLLRRGLPTRGAARSRP